MKLHLVIPSAALLALLVPSGCRKAEPPKPATPPQPPVAAVQPGTPPSAPGVAPTPATPVVDVPRPAVGTDEVARMIGFGAELPADFQTFLMVDVAGANDGFKATSFGKKIAAMAKEVTGISVEPPADDPPEPPSENEPATAPTKDPGDLFLQLLSSGRVYLASGPDTAEQTFIGLKLISFVQGLAMRASLSEMADQFGLMGENATVPDVEEMIGKEHANLMAKVEPVKIPAVILAMESKGKIAEAKEMLAAMDGQLAEMVSGEPYIKREEITREGGTFITFSVSPGDVVGADDIESAGQGIDTATAERYHKMLLDKKVVFGLGMKGEHVVFFLGSDAAQMRFAAKPSESLAKRAEFEMLAGCKDRNPFMVAMADGTVWAKARAGQDAGQTFDVIREVLDQCTGLGDTKDIAALLERVADTVRELSKGQDSPLCAAGWFDQGVRIEVAGGPDSPELDGSQPLAMAGRLATEDTILLVNARTNREYMKKSLDMVEDMAEISYELARRYAATEAGKEHGLADPLGIFHEKMLPHVVAAWAALSGDTGLGPEQAMVMDLGVGVPKLVGLPPDVATKVRIPRLTVAYPLEDRSKLDDTWKKLEPAMRGLIENLPLDADKKPTLPDPFSSEKNGMKTWIYPVVGWTTEDFVPAVSLGDKYFFLGSSKALSESLAARLAAPAAPAPDAPRGMLIDMRFEPLAQAAGEWLDALKANAGAVFPDEAKRGEFLSNENEMREAVDLMRGLGRLHVSRRPDGSRWRTSVHLQFAHGTAPGPTEK